MKRTIFHVALFAAVTFCLSISESQAQTNANADSKYEKTVVTKSLDFTPYDLRVEYMATPIGIGTEKPRFSWKLQSKTNDEKQTAYQITLSTPDAIDPVWDTRKVNLPKTVGIEYAGPELEPETVYLWNLTTWNKDGKESSTVQSRFSTGLKDWSDAKWIGLDEKTDDGIFVKLDGAKWLWPEKTGSAPAGKATFRKSFEISDKNIAKAQLAFTADNAVIVYLNGEKITQGTNFNSATAIDVKRNLKSGKNVFAIEVENFGDVPNPAGLIGVFKAVYEDGTEFSLKTDESWKTVYNVPADFQNIDFDDTTWKNAAELANYGDGPWNNVSVGVARKSIPARYLRKAFNMESPGEPVRATAYISGLGYYELYLNGKKIGDHVLDPILTDYDKQVPYVTYEIDPKRFNTRHNGLRVILGNGRFYAPRISEPMTTRTFGNPQLLFKMVIEYHNGKKQTILSDDSWIVSTDGPIRENCDYDGEIYDARKEISTAGDLGIGPQYYNRGFQKVQLVDAPKGKLVAQMMPPMRITHELRPKSLKEVKPGVWVYDFGQNIVGWCRLKVNGPAGTQITLRHAERLQEDGPDKGMLYVENLRAAKCRDIYILNGQGNETYEPRFTYHGFQFAEITGFPGRPDLNTLTGCAVNTDLPVVGKFECSNELVNKIYKNIEWGVRGNYLSIPTDCPQRDERQGWQGDRAGESLGEMFIFDNYTLYAKWMKDVQDSQREDGNVSDVCPNFWPLYGSNVTWPSAFTIIPGSLYKMYGDERPIARHYEAMKKWMAHLEQFILEDGTIEKDNYGDWCVPPEKPELIHSNDPARQTARGILATSYYINNLNLLAKYGEMLGKKNEAETFRNRAAKMAEAFNKRFYDAEKGQYDNGTQTSCVLPLAFDLVPQGDEGKVFATLVNNIENVTNNHIGTGLIGGQWLNMTLAEFDRNDIAYKIVSNNDYPSWGYMVEKGATTIWELWNGDTANPAMNSGNHVMLVGDLVIWLYNKVAGIPMLNGDATATLRYAPTPGGDFTFAKAEYNSAYGMIKSSWRISDNKFFYDVTIPVGRTAEIRFPTEKLGTIREEGNSVKTYRQMTDQSGKKIWCVCTVPSGSYSFVCEL